MHRLKRGRWPLVLAALLAIPVSALAGPEIFSIEPESGPAGTPIQLKGTGLLSTGRIVFAVGRTISRARFKVVSDQEVDIIAPDYFRPGGAATVAVFTEHGAAVAMPATVQTVRSPVQGTNVNEIGESFFHVLDGGVLSTAGAVAVIEQGGVVVQSSNPAMQFVKSGGALLEFHNGNGIVFYEPGAKLGPGVVKPNRPVPVTLVRVPEITACPGVGPFRFVAAAAPDLANPPAVPPVIRGLSSRAAPAGAIVTLTGNGFARTIEVSFLGPTGAVAHCGVPGGFGPRAQGGGSRRGCHVRSAAHCRPDQPRASGHCPAESDDSPHRHFPVAGAIQPCSEQGSSGSVPATSSVPWPANRFSSHPADWSPRPRRTASISSSTTAGWATTARIPTPSFSNPARSFPIASNRRQSERPSRSSCRAPSTSLS